MLALVWLFVTILSWGGYTAVEASRAQHNMEAAFAAVATVSSVPVQGDDVGHAMARIAEVLRRESTPVLAEIQSTGGRSQLVQPFSLVGSHVDPRTSPPYAERAFLLSRAVATGNRAAHGPNLELRVRIWAPSWALSPLPLFLPGHVWTQRLPPEVFAGSVVVIFLVGVGLSFLESGRRQRVLGETFETVLGAARYVEVIEPTDASRFVLSQGVQRVLTANGVAVAPIQGILSQLEALRAQHLRRAAAEMREAVSGTQLTSAGVDETQRIQHQLDARWSALRHEAANEVSEATRRAHEGDLEAFFHDELVKLAGWLRDKMTPPDSDPGWVSVGVLQGLVAERATKQRGLAPALHLLVPHPQRVELRFVRFDLERIVVELANNASKALSRHKKAALQAGLTVDAPRVVVIVGPVRDEATESRIRVSVTDNGPGFTLSATEPAPDGGGQGLDVLDVLAAANDCRIERFPTEVLPGAHIGLWVPVRFLAEV